MAADRLIRRGRISLDQTDHTKDIARYCTAILNVAWTVEAICRCITSPCGFVLWHPQLAMKGSWLPSQGLSEPLTASHGLSGMASGFVHMRRKNPDLQVFVHSLSVSALALLPAVRFFSTLLHHVFKLLTSSLLRFSLAHSTLHTFFTPSHLHTFIPSYLLHPHVGLRPEFIHKHHHNFHSKAAYSQDVCTNYPRRCFDFFGNHLSGCEPRGSSAFKMS